MNGGSSVKVQLLGGYFYMRLKLLPSANLVYAIARAKYKGNKKERKKTRKGEVLEKKETSLNARHLRKVQTAGFQDRGGEFPRARSSTTERVVLSALLLFRWCCSVARYDTPHCSVCVCVRVCACVCVWEGGELRHSFLSF